MEFKFEPLEEFTRVREYPDGSKVTIGHYLPGGTYNCTKEPRHDALRDICTKWESEGKIRKVFLKPNQSFQTKSLGA